MTNPSPSSEKVLKGRKNRSKRREIRKNTRFDELKEIKVLEKRIAEEAPPSGTNPMAFDHMEADEAAEQEQKPGERKLTYSSSKKFSQLPITERSKAALRSSKMVMMTAIQRATILHALVGRDILGAARTGSGKTLAFVVPVIEALARRRWTRLDGVGALIISPTRELAMQIFEVLRVVGAHHDLSAGLVIGGKDYSVERDMLPQMNVIVGTPGRVLHHFDNTPLFHCDNLAVLVLDEADRCLDMGFKATLNAIVSNLPTQRQTLLFSATQTRSVSALARLSLNDPEYIAVHEHSESATPKRLLQSYMVVDAHQKLDVLWSFMKSHQKDKFIVFVSSRKQVRFMFECFRRMKPGLSLFHIHGSMGQQQRMAIFFKFTEASSAALISTDLAARGLDIPDVNWVLQFDCPDSADTYIHRVGRTARYKSDGKALALLLPSEVALVEQLKGKKVELKKVKANPSKLLSVTDKIRSFLAEDTELKYVGQKAFVSYMRSVHLASDKSLFDVTAIDAAALSTSMGLPGTPKIKFTSGLDAKKLKNMPIGMRNLLQKKPSDKKAEVDKVSKILNRKNTGVYSKEKQRMIESDEEEDEQHETDLMVVSRRDHDLDDEHVLSGKRFDPTLGKRLCREELASEREQNDTDGIGARKSARYAQEIQERLAQADPHDKLTDRQRVQGLHRAARQLQRQERQRPQGSAPATLQCTLGSSAEDEEEDSSSDDDDDDDDNGQDQSLHGDEALAMKILASRRA